MNADFKGYKILTNIDLLSNKIFNVSEIVGPNYASLSKDLKVYTLDTGNLLLQAAGDYIHLWSGTDETKGIFIYKTTDINLESVRDVNINAVRDVNIVSNTNDYLKVSSSSHTIQGKTTTIDLDATTLDLLLSGNATVNIKELDLDTTNASITHNGNVTYNAGTGASTLSYTYKGTTTNTYTGNTTYDYQGTLTQSSKAKTETITGKSTLNVTGDSEAKVTGNKTETITGNFTIESGPTSPVFTSNKQFKIEQSNDDTKMYIENIKVNKDANFRDFYIAWDDSIKSLVFAKGNL